MRTRAWHILPLLAATSVIVGCDNDETPENVQVALHRAESCEDLESKLKADAIAKMNRQIDAEIRFIEEGYWDNGWFGEDALAGGDTSSSTGTGGGSADSGSGGNGSASAPAHSETNTQVEGVDEADIVKTDGNYLYVLHGRELAVVNAYPASDLAVGSTTEIEGHPSEMFLADDKIIVFSNVDGTPIFEDAGVEAPTPDYGYGDCYDCGGYYPGLTKVTVMSLDGASPTVERELYFEGSYQSSRRIGSKVRAVLNGGYHPPFVQYYPENPNYWELDDDSKVAAYEQLRAVNAERIQSASLTQLLPYRFERDGGQVQVLAPSCGDYYVPTPGTTEYGMTQIQSFDIADASQAVAETQIIGHAQTVYASADAMYLVGQSWNDPWFRAPDWSEPVSSTTSHIHKFDIQDHAPLYEGSGSVPGWVNNQFSLDEKDGNLRIATTDELVSEDAWNTVNNVFVLGDTGARLETIGAVTGLAPDETVQSARFVGDMGYVVTFRQIDPLFAIDLSDPTQPQVLGELKIPGFSEYMHPIDDTHLLTIGRDGTDDGQILGVALSIFDVSNPLEPKLTHKHDLGDGSSEAEYDHKAFTLYEGTLAIPMVRWDYDFYDMTSSTLELFDIDAQNGITPLGGVDHSSLFGDVPTDYCYWYGYGVRRGVFIDNLVYSISEAGIIASDAANPAQIVSSTTLPNTNMGCDYGY